MEDYGFPNPPTRRVYKRQNDNKIPILFMMVGLPGSGKSTLADTLVVENERWHTKPHVHSSDALRLELYGDENSQEHNVDLFTELHKRIKNDLINGINVIYDATNISKKRRAAFLAELKNIPCHKCCICVMTPYDMCLQFNDTRERKVPNEVIRRMYMNWNPPDYSEGFNEIIVAFNYGDIGTRLKYTTTYLFDGEDGIDAMSQENSHHTLTLGHHCKAAMKYAQEHYPEDFILHIAALFHDNGKVFTKTHTNSRGEDDGQCHYYQHHCVGAYNVFFYLDVLGFSTKEQLYIANLIYYHMHPFTVWRQSDRAKRRCQTQIGDKMFADIEKLHEADLAAH